MDLFNDERPLPPGWSQKFHVETGQMYYINHETKTTTWEDPRQTIRVPEARVKQNSTSSIENNLFDIENNLFDIESDLFEMVNTEKRRLGEFSDKSVTGKTKQSGFEASNDGQSRNQSFGVQEVDAAVYKGAPKSNVVVAVPDHIETSTTSMSNTRPTTTPSATLDQLMCAINCFQQSDLFEQVSDWSRSTRIRRKNNNGPGGLGSIKTNTNQGRRFNRLGTRRDFFWKKSC